MWADQGRPDHAPFYGGIFIFSRISGNMLQHDL